MLSSKLALAIRYLKIQTLEFLDNLQFLFGIAPHILCSTTNVNKFYYEGMLYELLLRRLRKGN